MNVKLTTMDGSRMLVNWDNVDFIVDTMTHFGKKYTEIHCGEQRIDVKESLEKVEKLLTSTED